MASPLRLWPVLVILLLAALIPSACVIWFMNEAMDNQQLAMRQRMMDFYEQQIKQTRGEIDDLWNEKTTALNQVDRQSPSSAFASLVKAGIAQSVIICDENKKQLYPYIEVQQSLAEDPNQTLLPIQQLEFAGNVSAAMDAVRKQFALSSTLELKAECLRIEARCLIKLDRKDEAITILVETLNEPMYDSVHDAMGRHIPSDALLRALELIQPHDGDAWQNVCNQLITRVNNYGSLDIPASQRRFLMSRLRQWTDASFPTLEAETLACQYLQQEGVPAYRPIGLTLSSNGKFWTWVSDDGTVIALFTPQQIQADFQSSLPDRTMLVGASMKVHMRGQAHATPHLRLSLPLGPMFRDWQISVYDPQIDRLPAAIAREKAVLLWSAVAVIGLIAIMSLAMTAYIARSMRLTRLKNDLIATVSHELKTPLASMRLLVDTLREDRLSDPSQAKEYLDLIASENQRLTRLIDNFLAFSRMERNKDTFVFEPVNVSEVITEAVACVQDRFKQPDGELKLEIDPSLQKRTIHADRDALVTVLLNLLDNAWKYTGNPKAVRVRGLAVSDSVFIEVSDNGNGLSRQALARVFDRFYQVDQSLSRHVGGCGLGLSIVKFIVDAHDGTISVDSQVGKGSMFTLQFKTQSTATSLKQVPEHG